MSNKRRKKRRLGAVKIVKAQARATIGTPKPTTIFSNTPKAVPPPRPEVFSALSTQKDFIKVREKPEEEFIPGSPTLMRTPEMARGGKSSHWHQSRVYHREGTRYSEEIIAHANFLLASKGSGAAEEYLDKIKQGGNVSTNIVAGGSIELSVKEARDKVSFYRQQVQTATIEMRRWEGILDALEGAQRLITAPASSVGQSNTAPISRIGVPKAEPGFWETAVVNHFKNDPSRIKKSALKRKLEVLRPGISSTTVYGPIAKAIREGLLKEDENGWVSPTELLLTQGEPKSE